VPLSLVLEDVRTLQLGVLQTVLDDGPEYRPPIGSHLVVGGVMPFSLPLQIEFALVWVWGADHEFYQREILRRAGNRKGTGNNPTLCERLSPVLPITDLSVKI
jgi:hypothetical protein